MAIDTKNLLVHAALLGATMAIGAGFVATKAILAEVPAPVWAFTRIAAAGLVLLLLFGRNLIGSSLGRRDWAMLAGCALLGIVANQGFFVYGLRQTTSAHAAMLNGLVPLLTMLCACSLGRESLTGRKVAAMGLALSGVAHLMNVGSTGWSAQTLQGDGMMLVNSVCYALYLVLSRDLFRRHGWQVVVPALFAWAVPGIAVIGLAPAMAFPWQTVSATTWALMAFVVVAPSVGSYIAFGWAMQRIDASTAAAYGYVQPLVAIVLSAWLLGEPITARVVTSLALIFAGLALVILPVGLGQIRTVVGALKAQFGFAVSGRRAVGGLS